MIMLILYFAYLPSGYKVTEWFMAWTMVTHDAELRIFQSKLSQPLNSVKVKIQFLTLGKIYGWKLDSVKPFEIRKIEKKLRKSKKLFPTLKLWEVIQK